MAATYFNDSRFVDLLVSLLVKDQQFNRTCSSLLESKDFKPARGAVRGKELFRWVAADLAISHYAKYKAPIRELLSAEVRDYCAKTRLSKSQQSEFLHYANRALRKKVTAVDSITDKVVQFKRESLKASAVQEMIGLQSRGELSDEKWMELCKKGIDTVSNNHFVSSDYFNELDLRIERRSNGTVNRFPLLLIDPIDAQVRAIARGHLGLIIAPYKRGKSLMLIHLAKAYALQRLNVLYFTLEDPKEDVEDRFDASITYLPLKKLSRMPKRLRARFEHFTRLIRSRLKIYDGTEHKVTVQTIEDIYETERNQGFIADVVIVDYDDEVSAMKRHNERRQEFAEIYRAFRQFAARKQVLLWTAAQTKRGLEGKRIIVGDDIAEDVSKIRKVSCAISLGQGDWGPDSIYMYVAAHKYDRQHVGGNIMANKERMLIYDPELTAKARANPEDYLPREEDETHHE